MSVSFGSRVHKVRSVPRFFRNDQRAALCAVLRFQAEFRNFVIAAYVRQLLLAFIQNSLSQVHVRAGRSSSHNVGGSNLRRGQFGVIRVIFALFKDFCRFAGTRGHRQHFDISARHTLFILCGLRNHALLFGHFFVKFHDDFVARRRLRNVDVEKHEQAFYVFRQPQIVVFAAHKNGGNRDVERRERKTAEVRHKVVDDVYSQFVNAVQVGLAFVLENDSEEKEELQIVVRSMKVEFVVQCGDAVSFGLLHFFDVVVLSGLCATK